MPDSYCIRHFSIHNTGLKKYAINSITWIPDLASGIGI